MNIRNMRFIFGVNTTSNNFGWDGIFDQDESRTVQVFKPGFNYEFQDIELTGKMVVVVQSPGILIISGFVSFGSFNKYKKCSLNFDFTQEASTIGVFLAGYQYFANTKTTLS